MASPAVECATFNLENLKLTNDPKMVGENCMLWDYETFATFINSKNLDAETIKLYNIIANSDVELYARRGVQTNREYLFYIYIYNYAGSARKNNIIRNFCAIERLDEKSIPLLEIFARSDLPAATCAKIRLSGFTPKTAEPVSPTMFSIINSARADPDPYSCFGHIIDFTKFGVCIQ